jgi:hypothetical protein
MSLTSEWYANREKRQARRDSQGVTVEEAERALILYSSSIKAVALELGEWLLRNWSQQQIKQLSAPSQEILREIQREIAPPR